MFYNKAIELFRDGEYPMMRGKTYLDHEGTTIYAKSLVKEFSQKMMGDLYGNPHSSSDPAMLSGREVDLVREEALAFFGADPQHFDLVFTANATASIKLVADSFRDLALAGSTSGTFWYGYHKDSHTSLVGVREFTHGNGAQHCFGSDKEVDNWLDGAQNSLNVTNPERLPGLFAYPGQSNMTGRRLPLCWTGKLRNSTSVHHQNTYSLLDAAALATTTQLDFSDPDTAPDFTALSFYKIFGFPHLGGLIVRKKSGHILSWRKYFGGGTVSTLTVLHEPTVSRKDSTLHEALEDGTLPFHSIMALGCAIDVHKRLFGSMTDVSLHTSYLARRLYLGMAKLRHINGLPVCVIHNDRPEGNPYENPKTQGATIAFNIVNPDGSCISHSVVEKLANSENIYLRTGGLCNPGGVASYLKVEPWQFKRAWSSGYRYGLSGPSEIINGKPTGVIRVSLGAMSTLPDVDAFLEFLSRNFWGVSMPMMDMMDMMKLEEKGGTELNEVTLMRRDNDANTGRITTSSSTWPSLVRVSSATSLPQSEPSLGQQPIQSATRTHKADETDEGYPMVGPVQIPKRMREISSPGVISSASFRLVSAGNMGFVVVPSVRDEPPRGNGKKYANGKKKPATVKFWGTRKPTQKSIASEHEERGQKLRDNGALPF